MNEDEMRYIRTLVMVVGLAIMGMIAFVGGYLADDWVGVVILNFMGWLSLSAVLAATWRGYNRRLWDATVGWGNEPLMEQKEAVEGGEKA